MAQSDGPFVPPVSYASMDFQGPHNFRMGLFSLIVPSQSVSFFLGVLDLFP